MKTPPNPSRRRGTRKNSAPRAAAELPESKPSTPVEATEPTGRGVLRKTLFFLPLPLAVVLAVCTWMIASDAQNARRQQQLATSRLLLTTQQLDSVFQQIWSRVSAAGQLNENDRALLETWVLYDEKYVAHDPTDRQSRFNHATAHRRIGQVKLALGNPVDSQRHFQQAIALFEELATNNPTVTGYVGEQADICARLAWAFDATRQSTESAEAARRASELVQIAPLPNDPVFNAQCAYTLVSLGKLFERWGQDDQVRTHLARAAELFQRLQQTYPDSLQYGVQLTRIHRRLGGGTPTIQRDTAPPTEGTPAR